MLTSKQRFLKALRRERPDRLPVTTHHVQDYFLKKYLGGMPVQDFFDHFGLDPITWLVPVLPYDDKNWRIETQEVPGQEWRTIRYLIHTPKGTLSMATQTDEVSVWVIERPIKEKRDIDLIGEYLLPRQCDVAAVNQAADEFGERGLVRGHVIYSEIYGQPGCWQEAVCWVGIEDLILLSYDDPQWVHELLGIFMHWKLGYVQSLQGARYDLIELGGGDASSTVISPKIFDAFVAPYDCQLVAALHKAGQRVVYHTCGGMMPFLERLAGIGLDAMETFAPPGMGGDTNLRIARQRIGDKVCMIGGFDQFHYFNNCSEAEIRAAVRACFEAAGENGGYILSPSCHFFDADPHLVAVYADEARKCIYE